MCVVFITSLWRTSPHTWTMTHTDEFNKSNGSMNCRIFQSVQFSVGRLHVTQAVPFCVVNINSPYCLTVFSAPHEQHKSGSIIWVGVKPEAAGHSRWLLAATGKLTPQRRASSLLSQSDPRGSGGPASDSYGSTLSCSAVGVGTYFITARVLFVIGQNY